MTSRHRPLVFRRFLLCAMAVFCGVAFAPAADPDPKATLILPTGPAGPCTVAQWKADWPGCEWGDGVKEGHFSIVERGGEKRFRVDYAVGGIGPEQGGVGWRFPFGRQEEAELRYTLRFSKDFDWVKGGKLPGLCGGPENVSGGKRADGRNGFSARLMWRADGRGEAWESVEKREGGAREAQGMDGKAAATRSPAVGCKKPTTPPAALELHARRVALILARDGVARRSKIAADILPPRALSQAKISSNATSSRFSAGSTFITWASATTTGTASPFPKNSGSRRTRMCRCACG